MKNLSKYKGSIIAASILTVFVVFSDSDLTEEKLVTLDYCKNVELWNNHASPQAIQSYTRLTGTENIVGHPDYEEIYDSVCTDTTK